MNVKRFSFILICLFVFSLSEAQKPKRYTSSEILKKIQKLNVLGTALYIAAHPDDENTRLIAYLSNHDMVETGYFSVTRGDGGQNLVGPEIRDELGIIRTQELLSARKVDGGNQFFSRGIDFGYSKHPDETFNMWNKEEVLSDLVWVIRKFKPDVIITRFNIAPGTTHGHHTASAILASEAFKISGDKNVYPEQLKYIDTWQPSALFWNAFFWNSRNRDNDKSGLIQMNVGKYDPILGQSYTELAAYARSMHKSQGFGATGSRGDEIEYMEQWDGIDVDHSIFDHVDLSWNRVRGGKEIENEIDKLIREYRLEDPASSVKQLISIRSKIQTITDEFWKERKTHEIDEIIFHCLGLYIEGVASDYSAVPGEEIDIRIEVINRSFYDIQLESFKIRNVKKDSTLNMRLQNNEKLSFTTSCIIPVDMPISQPYWLNKRGTIGMFNVNDQQLIGLPENPPAAEMEFKMLIESEIITFNKPIIYKRNDPVNGETYRPFIIIPPLMINIEEPIYIFPNDNSREIMIVVKSGQDEASGKLELKSDNGWKSDPAIIDITPMPKGEERSFSVKIYPPENQSETELTIISTTNGITYSVGYTSYEYEHIPVQVMFPGTKTRLVKFDIQRKGELIGYISGAGDDIPGSLERLGYKVETLSEDDFNNDHLNRFDAIILGIRAYNTEPRLRNYQSKLMDYVENGGTMIVQYNTNRRLILEDLGPYPLKLSRDRVTVEEAEIRILAEDHPILNFPNKITKEDFNGWVTERGLYFPNEWDARYTPIISSNDPGESEKKGGLLVAQYGKGYYIYTGYSWFRQLPAGVPGAYRIFTNMVSIGK
ncbi:PIG-L family deacetylase [Bacteroidota bacterium]